MRVVILGTLLMAVVTFANCGGNHSSSMPVAAEPSGMKYARNISIVEHEGFTEVDVRNPWDSVRVLQKYLLVPTGKDIPEDMPEGTLVRVPLTNALVYSTVHNSLAVELGALEAIGGVCSAEYINDKELRSRIADGRVVDCGESMSPDLEKIIKLHPQAILLSPFENNDRYARVGELGIPVVECADYMETSALGRAEWVKFYGLLFGRADEAAKMFDDSESRYLSLREAASKTKSRPKVLMDQRYGQVWNVPGGESTIAGVIRDAGGVNPFDSYRRSGSVPIAPEKVLAEAGDADVWLVRYNQLNEKTLKELATDAPENSRFKAFKEGNVFGCNTRFVDFYEETPFHPERLLEDMIRILHPELEEMTPGHGYYEKMN